ncbi:MAG TPA: hypothetical protein VMZ32_02025 [Gammaproteobacteria bacterium]|nr:hypothetical protein [Gammaproteobacteria bacterium]
MGRRKYRSQAEWSVLIEQQAQSGLSGAEFCKQHGVVAKCFYRKRLQLSEGKALVPARRSFVQVSPESPASTLTEASLMLQYRECRLQVPMTTDPIWLSRLLQSL